jgi:hypothetical protein
MKRALPILMLAAGLLWLAPAVRALPLTPDPAAAVDSGSHSSPDETGPTAPSPAPRATRAAAQEAPRSRSGVPQLVYVGLLGLLILGTDRRVERRRSGQRDAASPLP